VPRVPGRVAVGTVRGGITLSQRPVVVDPLRRLPLVASALLLFVLVGVLAVRGPRQLVWALLVIVLVLVAQWILGSIVRLGNPGRRSQERGWSRPFLALAGGVDALPTVDVRRFEVVAVTGAEYRCELVGQPRPAEPREGDIVQVYGRSGGRGAIRVHHLVGADELTTSTRLPITAVLVRIAYVASVVVSGVGGLAVCWLALRSPG